MSYLPQPPQLPLLGYLSLNCLSYCQAHAGICDASNTKQAFQAEIGLRKNLAAIPRLSRCVDSTGKCESGRMLGIAYRSRALPEDCRQTDLLFLRLLLMTWHRFHKHQLNLPKVGLAAGVSVAQCHGQRQTHVISTYALTTGCDGGLRLRYMSLAASKWRYDNLVNQPVVR
ncbi:hypothetical protein BR93DRAFT_352087 [Coniochaeta sp. PMI_546]|nr:hypothetical protein BR93DRAFT_352087 [Coniochaeta sp. PMI_546]